MVRVVVILKDGFIFLLKLGSVPLFTIKQV